MDESTDELWEARYRAASGRDPRFDGVFYVAVSSTGIYCRPSCPATTPKRHHVDFFRSAAAAQHAGFRACLRCLPDATPGSPRWDVGSDAAGRALALIEDGIVERDGVPGLAARLGYSERHLHRLLTREYGAGPLALARSRRAQAARTLIEGSSLRFGEVAHAAGFASLRQFNETVREVYARTPTELRSRVARSPGQRVPGTLQVRLAVREPFDAADLHRFLALHAVPGIEAAGQGWYERAVRLPHGPGVVRIDLTGRSPGHVPCTLRLADARDLAPATARTRRLLDADCDPAVVDDALAEDPVLAPLVRARPGQRLPGQLDGAEVAIQTVLGQQVSLASARTAASRLVETYGETLDLDGDHQVTRLFPSPAVLAGLDPEDPAALRMPRARARALVGLAGAIDAGDLVLDGSHSTDEVRSRMVALRGIGPWTADYVAVRALGDPDRYLPTDVGVRNAGRSLGADVSEARSRSWSPWRSYALMRLWSVVIDQMTSPTSETRIRA